MDGRAVAARLHDGPLQSLTAARLHLEALVGKPDLQPDLVRTVHSALASVADASTECRRLMEELDAEGP